jgi:hypothetical protein
MADFEQEEFEAFLRGDPLPPPTPPLFEQWFARLRQEHAEGKLRSRVHVIAGPLTPYLHYEIDWAYKANAAAGEDIRILHSTSWETSPFGKQPPDFYLLDDERSSSWPTTTSDTGLAGTSSPSAPRSLATVACATSHWIPPSRWRTIWPPFAGCRYCPHSSRPPAEAMPA